MVGQEKTANGVSSKATDLPLEIRRADMGHIRGKAAGGRMLVAAIATIIGLLGMTGLAFSQADSANNIPRSTELPIETTSDARGIFALGYLMPVGEVVTLAPTSGSRNATLMRLMVEEGDMVEAGQVLAIMDNEAQLSAQLVAAEATVTLREASLDQTKLNVAAGLAEARAELQRAQATAKLARQTYDRNEALLDRGTIPQATYDSAQAALNEALEAAASARATMTRFDSPTIDDQVDVRVAKASLIAAEAELVQARQDLSHAYIRAPIDGQIFEIHTRAGEQPDSDGILEMGGVQTMKAEIEIHDSRLGLINLGDQVEITGAALPQALNGRIAHIGTIVRPQTVIGSDPAANTDARVVLVQVELDATSNRIAARYTNLKIRARVLPNPGS